MRQHRGRLWQRQQQRWGTSGESIVRRMGLAIADGLYGMLVKGLGHGHRSVTNGRQSRADMYMV